MEKVEFEIKIADFGFSKYLGSNAICDTICGTPLYMSPQLVEEDSYSFKADMWSLGVIHFELLTGNRPFNGESLE